jgi:hypothetical protein
MQSITPLSYNDQAGQIFWYVGRLYRGIFADYVQQVQHFLSHPCYEQLTTQQLLVPHLVISPTDALFEELQEATQHQFAMFLAPKLLPFISYPSEWSFGMLKQAALLTLAVQKVALAHGFILKDAKADNVQFDNLRPIFIDILSFEVYQTGTAWQAYRQYCQHFLAPLALMTYSSVELHKLQQLYTDGIPLNLATKFLSWKDVLFGGIFQHLTLHSWLNNSSTEKKIKKAPTIHKNFTIHFIQNLTDSLQNTVTKLRYATHTNWANYYAQDVTDNYILSKKNIIERLLQTCQAQIVWDLGANTGAFSGMAWEQGATVYAFDADHDCVEQLFLQWQSKNSKGGVGIIDLSNPTPPRGFALQQYRSWLDRCPRPDVIFALALLHHLRITYNIPLRQIAHFFASLTHFLIIEFVPKNDEKVQILLQNKVDVYQDYSLENFKNIFATYFRLVEEVAVESTERRIFLMQIL